MNTREFRLYLQKYVNGGSLNASDRMLFLLSPGNIFRRNASRIQSFFQQGQANRNTTIPIHVLVKAYDGQNVFVRRMMKYLEENLKNDLVGAYVHGSLGTSEEISYSDFDALAILKDEVVNDKNKLARVAQQLNEARRFMLQMDPLQHHGWFVLTESDLKDYSETYFPSALFQYAKSLFMDRGLEINLSIDQERQDYITPFKKLCENIKGKISDQRYPQNVYDLKNLLSEFMLLPALYVQARDKKSIYKKFSFEEARKDFSHEQWQVMDDVSLIREQWNMDISDGRRKMIASQRFLSFNLSKIVAPKISTSLKNKLDEEFYLSMLNFTDTICNKIK